MSSDEIIKLLKAAGWRKVHQKGSHTQLRHARMPGKISVSHPKNDHPLGTAKAILKHAGISS